MSGCYIFVPHPLIQVYASSFDVLGSLSSLVTWSEVLWQYHGEDIGR